VAVDVLGEIAVQEGVLDIWLIDRPSVRHGEVKHQMVAGLTISESVWWKSMLGR